MVFPMCTNGIEDIFEAEDWNYEEYSKDCFEKFKIYPREDWAIINYGVSFNKFKSK